MGYVDTGEVMWDNDGAMAEIVVVWDLQNKEYINHLHIKLRRNMTRLIHKNYVRVKCKLISLSIVESVCQIPYAAIADEIWVWL